MQSSSSTHCQLFVSRKRYAWRRRMSFFKRFAWLQEYRGLYWDRTRKLVFKINVNKMQEHLMINQSGSKSSWETGGNTVELQNLMYFFLQLNSKMHIAKTKSKVDREVRDPSEQRILLSRLQTDGGDQRVQQGIEGSHCWHEQHRDLRALRNIFKTAMLWFHLVLRSRHCLFYLRKIVKNITEWNEGQRE